MLPKHSIWIVWSLCLGGGRPCQIQLIYAEQIFQYRNSLTQQFVCDTFRRRPPSERRGTKHTHTNKQKSVLRRWHCIHWSNIDRFCLSSPVLRRSFSNFGKCIERPMNTNRKDDVDQDSDKSGTHAQPCMMYESVIWFSQWNFWCRSVSPACLPQDQRRLLLLRRVCVCEFRVSSSHTRLMSF